MNFKESNIAQDWRYERKFFISSMSHAEVKTLINLHPAMFSEIYSERAVNNIYLDTINHINFFKNVDGQSQRLKIRIRWYGGLFGHVVKPVLELKIKNGQLGRKIAFVLSEFEFTPEFTTSDLNHIFDQSDLPDDIRAMLNDFNATLINRYLRKYYQTPDKKFRLTMDTDMQYFKVISNLSNPFQKELYDRKNSILELKYDRDYDAAASEISCMFPFRMTKSSKYVTGIEHFLTAVS